MERFKHREMKSAEKKINHRNGEDGRAFPYFDTSFRAFGAQPIVLLPMLQASWTLLESYTMLGHIGPFQTISDHPEHLGQYWTISDNAGHFR